MLDDGYLIPVNGDNSKSSVIENSALSLQKIQQHHQQVLASNFNPLNNGGLPS